MNKKYTGYRWQKILEDLNTKLENGEFPVGKAFYSIKGVYATITG
ncbi:MAG: hypothetical protein V2A65_08330 [Candidatus Omnitrophota bacterium]